MMKVSILGPVRHDNHLGGVASFTEGLYQGFVDKGDEATLLSFSPSDRLHNTPVLSIKENNFTPIIHAHTLAKAIRANQPDLVIASMMYGDGIRQFKKAWPHATYVMVLHGFPIAAIYGSLKTNFLNSRFRKMSHYFDHMVANSAFSAAINEQFYRIHCDGVIPLASDMPTDYSSRDRPYDFVYVGRLVSDKKIDVIAQAFLSLSQKHPDLRMAVAGSGPLEKEFVSGRYHDPHIDFKGPLSSEAVSHLLSDSKFFISLCGTESFGIAFIEAIKRGCNVLCPPTGGQAQFLSGYPFVHEIDSSSANTIEKAMEQCLDRFMAIPEETAKVFEAKFSYQRVANDFAELVAK